jgi:hypothetical protein
MTRTCAWCQTDLGERCPRCHSLKVTAEPVLVGDQPARAECGACGHRFRRGEGGETHGCCEPCRAKARGTIPPNPPSKIEKAWLEELASSIRFVSLRNRCSKAQAWETLVSVMRSPDTQKRIGANEV